MASWLRGPAVAFLLRAAVSRTANARLLLRRTWKVSPGVASAVGGLLPGDPEDCDWCEFCSAPKPRRAYHCRSCGVCILRRDHHCPSVDTCIGICNHGWFMLLLATQVGACVYYVWLFQRSEPQQSAGMVRGWARRAAANGLAAVALMDALYVGRLLIWQMAYLWHDITTIEHLRIAASAIASPTTGSHDARQQEGSHLWGLRRIALERTQLQTLPAFPSTASSDVPIEGGKKCLALVRTYATDVASLLAFVCKVSWEFARDPRDACARLVASFATALWVLHFSCRRRPRPV